jgi:hypothetical protein
MQLSVSSRRLHPQPMQTRTPTTQPARWLFWLATVVLALAALLGPMLPTGDGTEPLACAGTVAVHADCAEPVAADSEPDALDAVSPLRHPDMQLRPALAVGGDTQHLEPPPQRPPRART